MLTAAAWTIGGPSEEDGAPSIGGAQPFPVDGGLRRPPPAVQLHRFQRGAEANRSTASARLWDTTTRASTSLSAHPGPPATRVRALLDVGSASTGNLGPGSSPARGRRW